MSEETRTDLRLAEASIEVMGVLAEKKLEVITDQDGKRSIKGYVTINTDDTNSVTLNVWVNELTQKGEPNTAFAGMMTVMEDYHSIAEVGKDEATKVHCRRGNVRPNSYVGKEDLIVHSNIQYNVSYLTRVRDEKDYAPKAEIKIEGFINTIFDEVNTEGEVTGRLKIGLFVPTSKGVEPLEMIVPEETRNDFEAALDRGQTARFYADINNRTIVNRREIKLTVGGTRYETDRKDIRELVLSGAELLDESKEFSAEAIQKGLVERDLRLQREKEDRVKAKNASKAPAAATSRPLPKFSGAFSNM